MMTRMRQAGLLALGVGTLGALALWVDYRRYTHFDDGNVIMRFTADGDPLKGAPAATFHSVRGIGRDADTLQSWACFSTSLGSQFASAFEAATPVPPPAPIWLPCFDADTIAADLAAGRARAYVLDTFAPPSDFVVIAAVYPDGHGNFWRQTRASAGGGT
jgi:hypothetical protein